MWGRSRDHVEETSNAATPAEQKQDDDDDVLLASAYSDSVQRAREAGIVTLGFSLISVSAVCHHVLFPTNWFYVAAGMSGPCLPGMSGPCLRLRRVCRVPFVFPFAYILCFSLAPTLCLRLHSSVLTLFVRADAVRPCCRCCFHFKPRPQTCVAHGQTLLPSNLTYMYGSRSLSHPHTNTLSHYHTSHYHTTTLPHYHTTTLPHRHTTTLPHFTLPHYHTATLPHYHTTTLPHHHTATPPHHTTTTLPHCHTATLPHYHTTTLPHYHTTTLPHFHTFTLPHFQTFTHYAHYSHFHTPQVTLCDVHTFALTLSHFVLSHFHTSALSLFSRRIRQESSQDRAAQTACLRWPPTRCGGALTRGYRFTWSHSPLLSSRSCSAW
jgi:hypothetical protein